MNDIENLRSVRRSLVIRRRDLASRGAMSPADGGRSATQIRVVQAEIEAIDEAIADEALLESAELDRKAQSAQKVPAGS